MTFFLYVSFTTQLKKMEYKILHCAEIKNSEVSKEISNPKHFRDPTFSRIIQNCQHVPTLNSHIVTFKCLTIPIKCYVA